MAEKPALKKGAGKKIFATFLLTLAVTYVASGLLYGIVEMENLGNAVLDYRGVFEFVLTTDFEFQIIIAAIGILFFGWFLKQTGIRGKSYSDASDFGIKGTAKWGDPLALTDGKVLSSKSDFSKRDFKKGLKMEEGIVVGKVPDKDRALIIPKKGSSLDTMNVYVNGPSGSGKGQSYVYPNLINIRNESIVVIDPKGENYNATAQLKRDQGYKVYNIDFAEFTEARYNPLDYIKHDEDAQTVSYIIAENSSEEKDGFFKERAQSLLAALLSYVKATYPKEEANMKKVIEVFTEHVSDPEKCDEWMEQMPDNHPAKGLLESVLADLTSPNTRSGVTSSFQSLISIFKFHRIKEMTKSSDFMFDEFQEHKSILYVKMKVPTNPYKALTSIFFNQLIDRLFELGSKNVEKYGDPQLDIPIHLILDEFPNIGKINNYENTLSLARGYKIYMHTIVQDISQLQDKKLYGPEATKTIISNHSALLLLKVGEKDGAKYWSDWIGKTTLAYDNKSQSISSKGKTTSISVAHEQRDLMPANELMSMDNEKAILLLKGQDPVRIEKAWQFELYPNFLFNKNRLPNYLESRKRLGFTDEPVLDKSRESVALYFEDYQKEQSEVQHEPEKEIAAAINEESDELTQEEMALFLGEEIEPEEASGEKNIIEEPEPEMTDELTEEDLQLLEEVQSPRDDNEQMIDKLEEEINELNEIGEEIDDDLLQNALEDLESEFDAENDIEQKETEDDKKLAEELPM